MYTSEIYFFGQPFVGSDQINLYFCQNFKPLTMTKQLIYSMAIVLSLATLGCNSPKGETNPLLTDFSTPHQVPPFDKIKAEHFKPAYEAAIKQQQEQIAAIVASKEEPNFANTIEALEYSGLLLSKVESVFNNLTEANTNDSLQQIAEEVSPLVSANADNISLNAGLFQKVKAVYDKKDSLGLNAEQAMLLHNTYQGFVRGEIGRAHV